MLQEKALIHKFKLMGMDVLIDINSGAVHVIDDMIDEMMDTFDGTNDAAVIERLKNKYPEADLIEALEDLHGLIERKELFAPDIDVPPVFAEKPLVKSICLHVAHDCNLRCKYCFAGTGDFGHEREMMSLEVGKKAVDYIISNSGKRKHCELDFFGGEPLMNMPVVKGVTEYVRQREKETGKLFNLTLTTNGVLLNKENQKFLNDNNISVVLSLDGRKEVHDNMRPNAGGKGSYDGIVKNYKEFCASRNNENYYMRGTYTAHNLDFTNDVTDMADNGFTLLSVEPVVAEACDYAITEEHLPRIYEEYDKLTAEYLKRIKEGNGFNFFHFNVDINHGPCVAKRLSGCGAGHEYCAIAPNGDMYPCHQFVGHEEFKLGDVFEGLQNKELPQHFRQAHVLNKPECSKCWARFYCSGGCHANAELLNGDIKKPYQIGCKIQKKRLECAIMIQAKLAMEKMNKEAE